MPNCFTPTQKTSNIATLAHLSHVKAKCGSSTILQVVVAPS